MPSLRQIVATQLHSHQRNGAGIDHHQQNETADMCLQCASLSVHRHNHIRLLRQCAIWKCWPRGGLVQYGNDSALSTSGDWGRNQRAKWLDQGWGGYWSQKQTASQPPTWTQRQLEPSQTIYVFWVVNEEVGGNLQLITERRRTERLVLHPVLAALFNRKRVNKRCRDWLSRTRLSDNRLHNLHQFQRYFRMPSLFFVR